jgi:glycosyltransferase involved in cell wall biosynthesis
MPPSPSPTRVELVDPSAFTPPYDHALAGALARAGAEVELITSRFAYGSVPRGDGYAVKESFYRIAPGAPGSRMRLAAKLAQHVPDMARLGAQARRARPDVIHFQWLAVQPVDVHLLSTIRRMSGGAALVLTAHDVLPREPRPGQLDAQRRLYERVDAVIVHSAHGAGRLRDELRVDPAKVHVIPHGAFTHLVPAGATSGAPSGRPAAAGAARPGPLALPPELAHTPADRPVVLFFGLIRPYKGVDVLLDAWRGIDDAELWVVGLPKGDIAALRAKAPANVRFVSRFVDDDEIPPIFTRADLVVLPYREIDQSGVLFTALAFEKPLLLSAVGGFPEVAATGAAQLVPPGDAAALHDALAALLADPVARQRLAAAARAAVATTYDWDAIARQTLAVYATVTGRA